MARTLKAEYFLHDPKIYHSPNLIQDPMVSIIMPTYCRCRNGFLSRAIESVLSQSYQSFELIVIDDGSTDGTADLLSEFVAKDNRIIHVRHDRNSGLPALRVNEGLMLSRGHYFAYQFDDDRWTPDALQALVSELEEKGDCDVAYGRSVYSDGGNEYHIGAPFDYSKLITCNYIANNSVIHRRSVFERFGGYDMHLVMRRLCDWDLWLRWGRVVRFAFIDKVVSLVEAATEQSLGRTVHYDILTSRAHMARDRTTLLVPGNLKEYPIDDMRHLECLGKIKLEEVWRQQVAPFRSRHRNIWGEIQPKRKTPIHVLVTKAQFDTTVDITIHNFQDLLSCDFVFTFIPQDQVAESAIACIDILLLHRTIDEQALVLLRLAHRHCKCVVFLMDDDLLSFHELGAEFSYLAPGTACRNSVEKIIGESDLVVTYSRLMQDSVAPLNPRNLRLETNISSLWLSNARAKVQAYPNKLPERESLVIGFAGGGARKEEFEFLMPAIVEVSRRLKERVEFQFWGFQPSGIGDLQSPFRCEPFTTSYNEYMRRLTESGLDIMIAPLFAEKRAKRSKCPIKFLEISAAGAIGVYSDVEPYSVVADGVSGIKCQNTVEAWTDAILRAISLNPQERLRMLGSALEQIMREFTSESQSSRVAATLEAALVHSRMRRSEYPYRPRIAYFCHSPFLGGAENHLLRHALICKSFAFEPVLVLPATAQGTQDEMQRRALQNDIAVTYLPFIVETEVHPARNLEESIVSEVKSWLSQNRISLVHSVTLMREVGEACRLSGIPHVSSLYATKSTHHAKIQHCDYVHSDSLLYANQWAEVLGAPARRILSMVPSEYFKIGESRQCSPSEADGVKRMRVGIFGTVQPRKGQLQAIEAVGLLATKFGIRANLEICGYDNFFPDYVAQCREMMSRYDIEDQIHFRGFVKNTPEILDNIDIVLCASDWESMPQVILEGMAARALIVSPLVGGVGEILSKNSGVVIENNSPEAICEGLIDAYRMSLEDVNCRMTLAYSIAIGECREDVVAKNLFRMYESAFEKIIFKRIDQNEPESRDLLSNDVNILIDTIERVRSALKSA
jgi:O-antigen biosynthesis protein